MKKSLPFAAAASMLALSTSPALATANQPATGSPQMVQVQDQFRMLPATGGSVATICVYSVFQVGNPAAITVLHYKPTDAFFTECQKRASSSQPTPRTVSLSDLPPCSTALPGGTVVGGTPLSAARNVCPNAFALNSKSTTTGSSSPIGGISTSSVVIGAVAVGVAAAIIANSDDDTPVSP
ncbi:hypothetical protein [Sphingomicrobium astaxanthinifaciens]|uniref:hypothetical protein n=1 Tax=Sphingomicrobium astaxanthinifaciens TaxID=1227949 RepID=UPI001FCA6099|nr:hypothetical protein [Sphingomicrobium astaxanthinifaciens]MCJ7420422.1 hypothetical protein [Sphingomicrobium astaxanthinifaciens]